MGFNKAKELPSELLEDIKKSFICALVRNPWQRMVSSYKQLCFACTENHFEWQYKEVDLDDDKYFKKQRITYDLFLKALISKYNKTYDFKNKEAFKIFAKAICNSGKIGIRPLTLNAHWRPQHSFVYRDNLPFEYNYIGKLENINEFFEVVIANAKNLKYKEVPTDNMTPSYNYQDYYDTKTVDMVGEFYQKDIELFDYEYVSLK